MWPGQPFVVGDGCFGCDYVGEVIRKGQFIALDMMNSDTRSVHVSGHECLASTANAVQVLIDGDDRQIAGQSQFIGEATAADADDKAIHEYRR